MRSLDAESLTAGSTRPDHTLTLKVGFHLMLCHCIDRFRGHVNGARHILKAVHTNLVMLK